MWSSDYCFVFVFCVFLVLFFEGPGELDFQFDDNVGIGWVCDSVSL